MSLSMAETFECPYCMSTNDIEVDPINDVAQWQIIDCQICCQPIDVMIQDSQFGLRYPSYLKMPASELLQRFQYKAHLRRNVGYLSNKCNTVMEAL